LGLAQILDSLKMLISDELPSLEIVSACKKANAIRNNIVHRACLTVTAKEAQEALTGIESFIRHFNPQI
jgi:hypothetical protein